VISTARLDLVPATIPMLRAAIEDHTRLGHLLDARVPVTWPPELLDTGALEWTIRAIDAGNQPHWQMYFVVLRERAPVVSKLILRAPARTLIGSSGFKGHPSSDGTVEIGYGIVSDHQRRGYATETVRGLLDFAFAHPEVTRVIAETLPELEPSKGVLARTGFGFIGEGSEPGVIRYEILRGKFVR
jgi:RimJ/RimL family protein N-acetyltransferase